MLETTIAAVQTADCRADGWLIYAGVRAAVLQCHGGNK